MNYVREISSLSYLGVLLNVPTTVFAYFMSRFEMYFPGLGFTKRNKRCEFEFYVLMHSHNTTCGLGRPLLPPGGVSRSYPCSFGLSQVTDCCSSPSGALQRHKRHTSEVRTPTLWLCRPTATRARHTVSEQAVR